MMKSTDTFLPNVRHVLITLFGTLGILALAVFVMLLVSPSIRYNVFRVVAEMPTVVTFFAIRGPVYHKDFKAAAAGLNRQLDWSKYYGTKRSMNFPGLMENTEFVVERLRFTHEHIPLVPFLKKLTKQQPDSFLSRVWLARSLVTIDPDAAFEHLEIATNLIPSDDRSFRIAIRAAMELRRPALAQVWCERYQSAQFGGPHPYRYNNVFEGTGFREIALETRTKDGREILVVNSGIRLGEPTVYDFDLPRRTRPTRLIFHLGLLAGAKVKVHEVVLYGPDGPTPIQVKDLSMTARHGYFLDNGTLVTTSMDGDVLTLWPNAMLLSQTDRVDIKLSIERLALGTGTACDFGVGQ